MMSATPANPAGAMTSTANGAVTGGAQVTSSSADQLTVASKLQRIQNLPYFVGLLNKDRFVPQPAVQNLQNDLYTLVGQLHPGDSSLASAFNLDLRKAQRFENITPRSAEALNRDFGALLVSAGARAETVADMQAQLKQIVNYNSTQPNSTIAATNSYSMILQVALSVGRPLVYPNAPSLLASDRRGSQGKIPITNNPRPSLTGNYSVGTNIQIVDADNKVILGRAAVDPNTGVYSVAFDNDLPDGTYTVRVRAEESGYVSDPSPRFTFKVVPPKNKK